MTVTWEIIIRIDTEQPNAGWRHCCRIHKTGSISLTCKKSLPGSGQWRKAEQGAGQLQLSSQAHKGFRSRSRISYTWCKRYLFSMYPSSRLVVGSNSFPLIGWQCLTRRRVFMVVEGVFVIWGLHAGGSYLCPRSGILQRRPFGTSLTLKVLSIGKAMNWWAQWSIL